MFSAEDTDDEMPGLVSNSESDDTSSSDKDYSMRDGGCNTSVCIAMDACDQQKTSFPGHTKFDIDRLVMMMQKLKGPQ